MRNVEERMLWLFKQVHGEVTGSCYVEGVEDDHDCMDFVAVNVMKDGVVCWTATRSELLFDYITMTADELAESRTY